MPTYVVIDDTEVAPESPVTSSLMTRLRDNALAYLGAPTGTKGIFPQIAAPLGWAIDATANDRALKIASAGGGTTGGTSAFSTVFALTATDGHALTESNIPAHLHGIDDDTRDNNSNHTHEVIRYNSLAALSYTSGGSVLNDIWVGQQNVQTGNESGPHDHDVVINTQNTGGGSAHAHNIDLRVAWLGAHVATKS